MDALLKALQFESAEQSETMRLLRLLDTASESSTRVVVETFLTNDTKNPWGGDNAGMEPDFS